MDEPDLVMCNLEALAQSLTDFPDQTRLLNTIKRMRLAQSCISDLKLAQDTCEALEHVQAATSAMSSTQSIAAEHAIIANAIILYARATSTAGARGERGSVSIRDRLSPKGQSEHDALVALRNKVIAHVHAEETVAESIWHQEYAVAATDNKTEWTVSCVTRRKQTDDVTLQRLKRLIPIAWHLLEETFQKRVAEIVDLMDAAQVPTEALLAHPIDPAEIFGSYEEAFRSWTQRAKGQSTGIIYR